MKLLCFPYAGAGPAVFQSWREALSATPVNYPAEAETTSDIVDFLMKEVAPGLRGRFAFFGHSMGAGVAFEFTRALRALGLELPAALLVSAATAPQLRTIRHPEPTDEELIILLSRIHGNAASEDTLRALLRRFGPDVRLHRRYVYYDAPPLDIPIYAYGGAQDTTVPLERLESWAAQTTAGFRLRLFPGGHMYMDRSGKLVATLREDLNEFEPQ